jgi:hypothetical protein
MFHLHQLLLLASVIATSGEFVGVDVRPSTSTAPVPSRRSLPFSSSSEYGCMPAKFTSEGPLTNNGVSTLVNCDDGCQDSDFHADLTGSTALLQLVTDSSSACMFSERVARAKALGAVGVIVANHIPGEVPYSLSWDYTELLPGVPDGTTSSIGIRLAVCMLSYADGVEVVAAVTATSTVVDFAKFGRWERSNEPSTGKRC